MKKKIIIPLVILVLIIGGTVFFYKKFIVWDEEPEVTLKENIETSVVDSPRQDKPSVPEDKKESINVVVKGRITVAITREDNLPLENAVIFLESGGKRLREEKAGKSGVVVFDQIGKGSYKVGAYREGDGRIVSKDINLGEGEITSVSLKIYLDTDIKITASVKSSSGEPIANQSLLITREDGLSFTVKTNDQGIFVIEKVPPDDNWKLIKDGDQIAHFKVAPTGQDQTINVQTTGS